MIQLAVPKGTPLAAEAEAGTPQWFAARRGVLTASRMRDASAILKNGKPSEARNKLMMDLCAERLTGIAVPHYVNDAMQWGIDNQDAALRAYAALRGVELGPEVFVLHPEIEGLGATPDASVEPDGLVETKCPQTATHLRYLLAGVVPDEYQPQMLTQIACTRRKWVDFVSYDPRMPVRQQLFVVRFTPTAEQIQWVEDVARAFLAELDEMFDRVSSLEVA